MLTKKEIIWRELLYQVLEKNIREFMQKDIAAKFRFSLSTVFNALKAPREIKAVKVTGRNFIVLDPEKLLYLWATHRRLAKDIVYETRVKAEPVQIESEMPPNSVWTAYSAYQQKFGESPADYDKVYVYSDNLKELENRFPLRKGENNLIVLEADSFLEKYGSIATLGQTFVDIWNLPEWYSKDFIKALKEKILP